MEEIRPYHHISEYCAKVNAVCLHPLITVIEYDHLIPHKREGLRRINDYYSIFIEGMTYKEVYYGRDIHRYEKNSIVFVAPGQVFGVKGDGVYYTPKGWTLLFHPDFIRGTFLNSIFTKYNFFSYKLNEALFPTDKEREIIVDCFRRLEKLLKEWAKIRDTHFTIVYDEVDEEFKELVLDHLKTILDYCNIFYHRQFAAPQTQNRDILTKFEEVIDNYFNQERGKTEGVLTVKYCADQLCLSTNYFSDLIRKETGISALKHIHRKALEKAKELLAISNNSISHISDVLGFQFSQHFSKWFKSQEGISPSEYRKRIIHL